MCNLVLTRNKTKRLPLSQTNYAPACSLSIRLQTPVDVHGPDAPQRSPNPVLPLPHQFTHIPSAYALGFFSFFFFSAVGAAGVASTGVSSCEVVPRFSSTRAALRHPSWLVPASSLKHRGGTEANEQLEDGNMRGKMDCCLSVLHHGAHWQWCRGEEISPALAGGLGLDAAGLGLHRAPTRVTTEHPSISA